MSPPPLYRSESRREDAEDDDDENDEIAKLLSSYAPLDGRQFLKADQVDQSHANRPPRIRGESRRVAVWMAA